jgi:hypothetical protein
MCTYRTELLSLRGSGKGTERWFSLTDASVYVDHPVHAPDVHTLNIDLRNPGLGPAARVAVELDAASARALAGAIVRALDDLPPGLMEPAHGQDRSQGAPSQGT